MKNSYTTTTESKKPAQLRSLQGLRAVAFLTILSQHAELADIGAWGISLFVILSGFVLAYRYEDEVPKEHGPAFALEHIRRLYPLHLVMTLAAVGLVLIGAIAEHSAPGWDFWVKLGLNLALLQVWVPNSEIVYSLNGVSWFLSLCFFLYLCFPLLHRQLTRIRSGKRLLIMAILIWLTQGILAFCLRGLPNGLISWITYNCPLFRLGDFTIGILTGRLFLMQREAAHRRTAQTGTGRARLSALFSELGLWCLLVAVVLSSLFEIGPGSIDWLRYNVLYTPIVAALLYVTAGERGPIAGFLAFKPMVWLGDRSRYTYLIHQIVLTYLNLFCLHFAGRTLAPILRLLIALAVSLAAAEGCHRIRIFASHKRTIS